MKRYAMLNLALPVVFLTACATNTQFDAEVKDINQQLSAMQNDASVSKNAPVALVQASESVDKLNDLMEEGADDRLVDHQIYLVEKRLAIAQEAAATKMAETTVEQAELNRKDVLLSQSRQEAQMANQRAAAASSYAQQMHEKAKELEKRVGNLKTEQSERGLILTLDDILFAFNSTELKSGAERTLDNVADFLKEYPDRAIMVEGFTDSLGSDAYNEKLSTERAEAVKMALQESGIESARIEVRGYGEEYPVATNKTEAGRQENRRVEIILSDQRNRPVEERENVASR